VEVDKNAPEMLLQKTVILNLQGNCCCFFITIFLCDSKVNTEFWFLFEQYMYSRNKMELYADPIFAFKSDNFSSAFMPKEQIITDLVVEMV
jgi:hypothetical protein